ncbi:unnamed protein product [Bemisia tabaci]|uniref:RING-type domain-containing protein n=1 Tax=Bemisia tabaci TaxID=7038 RepID=A0A9P0EYS9_BEMTA|nr:unnamed protein product [Bemisia tabaci]
MEVDMVPFIFGSFTRKNKTVSEDSGSSKRRSSENETEQTTTLSSRKAKYRQFRIENGKMQCDVCNQEYMQPRTLPCLHTFCTNCLIRLTVLSQTSSQQVSGSENAGTMESNQESEKSSRYGSGSGNQNDGSNGSGSGYDSEQGSNCSAENPHRKAHITCPTCGYECKLSADGVFALPLHGLLQSRILAQQEDIAIELCQADAVETCHIHPGRELIMFCTRCNQLACRDCWILIHRGHSCDTVNHFMTVSIPRINEAIMKTKTVHKEVALSLSRLQSLEERIQRRCKEVEAEVDRWVTSYKRAIDEHRVNLLREVAQIRQAKLEQVQTQKEGLAGRAAHVSQAVAFTQDLLAEASDTEVVMMLSTVLNRLDWCVKNTPSGPSFRVSDCIQFLPEERACVIRSHTIYGVVTTQAVSPYHCIIEADGFTRCRQHKLCKLVLVSRDSDKQPICHGGAVVTAKLKYADATGRSIPVDVQDAGDGTYILSFTPDASGTLRLSVTVQDKYIQGSPFTVNVQTVKPHTGVFHCCSFCSSHGSKQVSCGCGGRMSGYKGCGHGHPGHPGRRHWSCCGNILHNSECSLYTSVFSTSSINCSEVPVK